MGRNEAFSKLRSHWRWGRGSGQTRALHGGPAVRVAVAVLGLRQLLLAAAREGGHELRAKKEMVDDERPVVVVEELHMVVVLEEPAHGVAKEGAGPGDLAQA